MTTPAPSSLQRSRGMRDLLPADMRAFRRVEDAFRAAASRWGYDEVRTPTIETYSLFTSAGAFTPHMLSRVYSFLDWDGWSGERVVLRPDSTIPVARAAKDGELALPARLFYVQSVFRFQAEGDRETWQCGLEYLDAPAAIGDLEMAAVGCEVLEALGLKPQLRLSHAGFARAIAVAVAAATNADPAELLDGVTDRGLGALAGSSATAAGLGPLVDVALRASTGTALLANLGALATGRGDIVAALDDVERVAAALTASGRSILLDFGMPCDFEYYTGVVFEFETAGRSWGRGGRYTPGAGLGGDSACGLALDLDRLAGEVAQSTRRRPSVNVLPGGAGDMARAMAVARALHRGGIAAALAAEAGDSLSVKVAGERLVARTPDGEREMASLDDLVGLLVQYK